MSLDYNRDKIYPRPNPSSPLEPGQQQAQQQPADVPAPVAPTAVAAANDDTEGGKEIKYDFDTKTQDGLRRWKQMQHNREQFRSERFILSAPSYVMSLQVRI